MVTGCVIVLCLLAGAMAGDPPDLIDVADTGRELGTSYDVVLRTEEAHCGQAVKDLAAARKLCQRLESELSEWRRDSEISRLNRDGIAQTVPVSDALRQLIQGASQVSNLTEGAFDITWKPLGALWDSAEATGTYPTRDQVKETLKTVGWEKIAVTDSGIRFSQDGVRLGIAGVAKGWIIDALFLFLSERGYDDIVVNIGGDLRTRGRDSEQDARTFTIADPFHPDRRPVVLEVGETAIATSGNYFRKREIEGRLVGHILDPRTGYPPGFTGSVTVLTKDAAMADALATAFFVLGPEEGLAVAAEILGVEAVYMTDGGVRATIPINDDGIARFHHR